MAKYYWVAPLFVLMLTTSLVRCQVNPVNWTQDQLMDPGVLASRIQKNETLPVIINVGPGAIIPNSLDAGMGNSKEGIQKLKQLVSAYPKDTSIVIYCGCCPFEHCPNVRPAIDALKGAGFTHYFLLNLPHNIRTDWISKGYPTKP